VILEGEGYEILHAGNAKDVLIMAARSNPSLILLDIGLAGTDGGTVAKKLKEQTATAKIPIVMLSANNATAAIAKKAGADGFLLKPFDMDDLIKTVKEYSS
jgi:CheY-like chemotaxis protein